MNFLYFFFPEIKYKKTKELGPFHSNLISEIYFTNPFLMISYITLSLIERFIPFLFIHYLGLSIGNELIGDTESVYFLFILVFLTFTVSVINIHCENFITLRLCNKFEKYLAENNTIDNTDKFERIVSRDFSLILENIGSAVNLLSIPIFIAISLIYIFYSYGKYGIIYISIISIFIPISIFISKKGDSNYEKIMDVTAERIELCSSWLKIGPIIKKFITNEKLDNINNIISRELFLRNIDSILRGADNYLVGFGRLLPFFCIGLVVSLYDVTKLNTGDGLIILFTIPILSAILSIPQDLIDYKASVRSLKIIKNSFNDEYPETTVKNDDIVFDSEWPIWPATVKELTPELPINNSINIEKLLKELRLIPEFGNTSKAILDKEISLNAENISEGQKLRLQLFRALVLASSTKCDLTINEEFYSLEKGLSQSIKKYIFNFSRSQGFTVLFK